MEESVGEWIARGSVWVALLCYPAGTFGLAATDPARRRVGRLVWTAGCLAFLVHVASSFDVFYGWSHTVALRETARQVEATTGRPFGAGLYLNYLFGLIWVADVLRWWRDESRYLRRPAAGLIAMHGFFLFMIFNGAVVFEDGPVRPVGLAVTIAGVAGLWRATRRRRGRR